jgi:signal transduction histidine kinase
MNLSHLIAIVASLGVGCVVLYINPKRAINRAFLLASVNVAAWLISLSWLTDKYNTDPEFWIRMTSALGGFIPLMLWIIKDSAIGGKFGWGSLTRGWLWLVTALVMAADCFSGYFIPEGSTSLHPLRGPGWTAFLVVNAAAYIVLLIQSLFDLRKVSGIQKVELQTLMFGGSAAGFVAIVAVAPILSKPLLPQSLPIIIVAFYTFTAWAITTQKVFDGRHLFRSALRLGLSIGAISAAIAVAMSIDPAEVSRPVVIIACAALITVVYNRFNLRILRATLLGGDREEEGVRSVLLAAGRDEYDYEVLVKQYSAILAAWGRADRAYFLTSSKESYTQGDLSIPMESPAMRELLKEKWATPESLFRQRDAEGRRELAALFEAHRFGVMICAPSDVVTPPFIIALKARRDLSPFTWSEIKQLNEWAGIIENSLSRISLTQQARESEQLRTAGLLGASLAHEIRNPLVTLKTIAQSARTRYHDPDFKRLLIDLVPAEIERIEGLVSGLMDLGRPQYPHFERVSLNEIVGTSVKLVRPKALDEAVNLTCALDANPDEINGDRASIRQVILNLVMNAIQAVAAMDVDREVNVRTIATPGSVVLEVADNGPGMPPEVRARLFQPFTTSNKTSGIGLGLAITADLVKLHHGQISLVERDEAGTTFRVTLPCQQPSS